MKQNAMNEVFEDVTLFGHPVLFSCSRIDKNTVPSGLYMYDVRHDDDQQGIPIELAEWVFVNHWGTIITDMPIRLDMNLCKSNGYRSIGEEDWNYEGTESTIRQYIEREQR